MSSLFTIKHGAAAVASNNNNNNNRLCCSIFPQKSNGIGNNVGIRKTRKGQCAAHKRTRKLEYSRSQSNDATRTAKQKTEKKANPKRTNENKEENGEKYVSIAHSGCGRRAAKYSRPCVRNGLPFRINVTENNQLMSTEIILHCDCASFPSILIHNNN